MRDKGGMDNVVGEGGRTTNLDIVLVSEVLAPEGFTARAGAGWVATLDHEAGDIAMEDGAVEEEEGR
jgi:hypothetical protein